MVSRYRTIRAGAAILILALAAMPASWSQENVIRGEFWAELEPVAADGAPRPVDAATAFSRLVEEAAFVYAGLTWGFSFVYTPPDAARRVEEVWEFQPLGAIVAGDARLRVSGKRMVGTALYLYVDFLPSTLDARRMDGWSGADYRSARGSGDASVSGGVEARREAYGTAVKEALRAYLRPIVKEKPREVRGTVAFAAVPRIVLVRGAYSAIVRLRVRIDAVVPYAAY
ncbi:MAG: hypothetical protein NT080_04115 [Spirochaetes bacterium]|nr:hypothetical protein [Spirochaetota bacterium]